MFDHIVISLFSGTLVTTSSISREALYNPHPDRFYGVFSVTVYQNVISDFHTYLCLQYGFMCDSQ